MPCEVCHRARYNRKTLDVHFKDKSIADNLGMTIGDSLDLFAEHAIISGTSGRSEPQKRTKAEPPTSSTSRPPACTSTASATC